METQVGGGTTQGGGSGLGSECNTLPNVKPEQDIPA